MTPTDELNARVRALPLEKKIALLIGADFWSTRAEPELGLRRMILSDGPVGVRGTSFDERSPSANLPSPTSLAATWDIDRAERIGRLLASEARRKGVHVLLAPTVNLQRSPYGGRHFECFSEDPLLTGLVGAAYVRGVQSGGVAATVKHFVANDSETERMTVNAVLDPRALREVYLAPFETIVRESQPWLVMAAYNSVNGDTMTEHPMLEDVLRREWGFDGVVVSDWFATRSTTAAARGGLDLAMPGPDDDRTARLVTAVREGWVPETTIDSKLLRLLGLADRVGALGDPAPSTGSHRDDVEIASELRSAAAAGFVLARNENDVLPLPVDQLRRVAVLGANASVARTLGGGSATVLPPYTVSPLDGLRAVLGPRVEIRHHAGVRVSPRLAPAGSDHVTDPQTGEPGFLVRFLDSDGRVVGEQHRTHGKLTWLDRYKAELPISAVRTIEIHARLRASQSGKHSVGCAGVGWFQLLVDGRELIETDLALPADGDLIDVMVRPPQRVSEVPLDTGQEVGVVLRHRPHQNAFATMFGFCLEPPALPEDEELERAVSAAADCDAAIVVVGTSDEVESEGFDRASLDLPGRQDELVRRVAAVNPRTVVVVNSGGPVLLPWADDVPGILLSWFPGQEFGTALADVLTGAVEPGGRLPVTWPADERGPLATTRPQDGELAYAESIHIGHRSWDRAGVRPAFCFGHGLGFTSWKYENLVISGSPTEGVVAEVTVRNTGEREGREVVQAYLTCPDSSVDRPVRWLASFATADVAPGARRRVRLHLPARAFAHWDESRDQWVTEPGGFTVEVGRSSRDVRLRRSLDR